MVQNAVRSSRVRLSDVPHGDGAVFVDLAGRRARRWVAVAVVLSMVMLAYIAVLLVAVLLPAGAASGAR